MGLNLFFGGLAKKSFPPIPTFIGGRSLLTIFASFANYLMKQFHIFFRNAKVSRMCGLKVVKESKRSHCYLILFRISSLTSQAFWTKLIYKLHFTMLNWIGPEEMSGCTMPDSFTLIRSYLKPKRILPLVTWLKLIQICSPHLRPLMVQTST